MVLLLSTWWSFDLNQRWTDSVAPSKTPKETPWREMGGGGVEEPSVNGTNLWFDSQLLPHCQSLPFASAWPRGLARAGAALSGSKRSAVCLRLGLPTVMFRLRELLAKWFKLTRSENWYSFGIDKVRMRRIGFYARIKRLQWLGSCQVGAGSKRSATKKKSNL